MNRDIDKIINEVQKIRESVSYTDYPHEVNVHDVMSADELETLVNNLEDSELQNTLSHVVANNEKADNYKRLMKSIAMAEKKKQRSRYFKLTSAVVAAASVIYCAVMLNTMPNNKTVNPVELYATNTLNIKNISKPTLITNIGDSIELKKEDKLIQQLTDEKTLNNKLVADVITEKILVPKGHTHSIVLSDGTMVDINAGTVLTFPSKFNDSIRQVEVMGEAYFKVTKSEVPFVVKLGDMSVKVYGTEFNVNSKDRELTEAVLVSGSVGVTINGGSEIRMLPNELVSYNTVSGKSNKSEVFVEDYLSWRQGEFNYIERDFNAVMNDISAWYGVTFKLESNISSKITCMLDRDSDIDELLDIIEKAISVKFIKTAKYNYDIENN